MKNQIKNWWLGPRTDEYTKPKASLWYIQNQLKQQFNIEEFSPEDIDTFTGWWFRKRKIKLGVNALRGVILIPAIDKGCPRTIRKPKTVYLYHRLQTEEIS